MLGQFGCKVKNFEEELLAELVTDVLNTLKLTLMINFAKFFPKQKKNQSLLPTTVLSDWHLDIL